MNENIRASFVFYKDWYNVIAKRDSETRLEVYDAIMKKVFENEDLDTSEISSVVLDFIMPQVERDTERWLDIREKRSVAGKQHKGNQYQKNQMLSNDNKTERMEQVLSNVTSVPTLEQNGTNGTVNVNVDVDVNNNKEIEDKSSTKKSEEDAFVEYIYKMYPTKCPIRKISLGKSYKDKERIRKLLKTYSMDDIEKVVKEEINEKYGKCMMSNFSTFLNNFPDPTTMFDNSSFQDEKVNNEENPYVDYIWQ